MDKPERSYQLIIATFLLLLMVATRYHHFGSVLHLPDASWAIFLVAGFYLHRLGYLAAFLAAAGAIDYFAITQGGTSNYCISAAYVFLIPAYAALWWGGRTFRNYYQFKWTTLIPLAGITAASVAVCFFISNGAFYVLSGKFGDLNMAEYISGVTQYFPMFLNTTLGYVVAFAVSHSTIKTLFDHYHSGSTSPH